MTNLKSKLKKWFLISSGLTVGTLISTLPISCSNSSINKQESKKLSQTSYEELKHNSNTLIDHQINFLTQIQTTIQNSQVKDTESLANRLQVPINALKELNYPKNNTYNYIKNFLSTLKRVSFHSEQIIKQYKENIINFFPNYTIILRLKTIVKELSDIQSKIKSKQDEILTTKNSLQQVKDELSKSQETQNQTLNRKLENLKKSQKELEKTISDLSEKQANILMGVLSYNYLFNYLEDKSSVNKIKQKAQQWQIEKTNLDKIIIALSKLPKFNSFPKDKIEYLVEYFIQNVNLYIEDLNMNYLVFNKISEQFNLFNLKSKNLEKTINEDKNYTQKN
ncbi:hypothetical protein [Mycoplasma sp. 3686d]|uniref:hypothetical protein n=1 Tax=Mycoplasma sp. 3686d TaxID=2967300 RepID=UPI00211D02E4|nr:hypothetical protein [Mycoplasma sp. 3686d]UUM24563.1 hypothetical protein NPA12_02575 [Mycoplasma sp. 3686d]